MRTKIVWLFIVSIGFLFHNCVKEPVAGFSVVEDKEVVEIGEEICFINESEDAYSYEWYFGDSFDQDTEEAPCHSFVEAGDYIVTLIAKSGNFQDVEYKNIIVIDPNVIQLYIHVDFETLPEGWNINKSLKDVEIELYPNEAGINQRIENIINRPEGVPIETSNDDGWVKFAPTIEGEYFVFASFRYNGQLYTNVWNWEYGGVRTEFLNKGNVYEHMVHLKKLLN